MLWLPNDDLRAGATTSSIHPAAPPGYSPDAGRRSMATGNLFLLQCRALTRKNLILLSRMRRLTIFEIIAPLLLSGVASRTRDATVCPAQCTGCAAPLTGRACPHLTA